MARIQQFETTGLDHRMVLRLRPRSQYPTDTYFAASVVHPTGDRIGVLLSEEELSGLTGWLGDRREREIRFDDGLTHAWFRRHPSGVTVVTCGWHGTRRSYTVALSAEDVRAAHGWLARLEREGWAAA